MAKEKDWLYEQDGCADCGELYYEKSSVDGLCQECLDVESTIGWAELDYLDSLVSEY